MKPILEKQAKERQINLHGNQYKNAVPQKSAEQQKRGDTRDELAKMAGVSHDIIHKTEIINKEGTPEQIERARIGGPGNSISAIYKEIRERSVKMQVLKVDPEFERLIPPLDREEFKQLEENIVAEGCLDPLVTWDGTIVDGHNRYKICQEHDIPFHTTEKDFDNRDEVIVWIIKHQIGRRNLIPY